MTDRTRRTGGWPGSVTPASGGSTTSAPATSAPQPKITVMDAVACITTQLNLIQGLADPAGALETFDKTVLEPITQARLALGGTPTLLSPVNPGRIALEEVRKALPGQDDTQVANAIELRLNGLELPALADFDNNDLQAALDHLRGGDAASTSNGVPVAIPPASPAPDDRLVVAGPGSSGPSTGPLPLPEGLYVDEALPAATTRMPAQSASSKRPVGILGSCVGGLLGFILSFFVNPLIVRALPAQANHNVAWLLLMVIFTFGGAVIGNVIEKCTRKGTLDLRRYVGRIAGTIGGLVVGGLLGSVCINASFTDQNIRVGAWGLALLIWALIGLGFGDKYDNAHH